MAAHARPVGNLRELRTLLAERFPDARPLVERDAARVSPSVPTGVAALDRALPGGGFPRGKLTAWAPDGSAGPLLRSACHAARAAGKRAAWVDGTDARTDAWAVRAGEAPVLAPLLVASDDRTDALRRVQALPRSEAFALVVLVSAPGEAPQRTETVRLTRAARDGGAALVVCTEHGSMAAVRVESRLLAHGMRWRPGPFGPAMPVAVHARVRVRALGWHARADVELAVAGYDVRDALEPGRDRRGDGPPRGPRRPAALPVTHSSDSGASVGGEHWMARLTPSRDALGGADANSR